jgi:hypothetical protein
MQDMMQQAKLQVINLAETWKHSSAEQRQEMVRAFFPAGIWYSQQMTYFKPCNSKILQLFANYLQDESLVGVPREHSLNTFRRSARMQALLLRCA